MLFTDLQTILVARLNEDAYFSDPAAGVTALAENRMDLLAELDVSLAKCGIGAVVAISRIVMGERRQCFVTISLAVLEIPMINRAPGGPNKSALDVLVKAMSLWGQPWTPNQNVWSGLDFQNYSLAEVDEATGRITWSAEFVIMTMLETVVEVLGTESGAMLVTEDGTALLNSPTAP